jgi:hypothetical protein
LAVIVPKKHLPLPLQAFYFLLLIFAFVLAFLCASFALFAVASSTFMVTEIPPTSTSVSFLLLNFEF